MNPFVLPISPIFSSSEYFPYFSFSCLRRREPALTLRTQHRTNCHEPR
ncbi:hypothetical protein LINPERPRIM_LOCUS22131 [Linum perenne]